MKANELGLTTEVAAIATFLLGAMATLGHTALAVGLGIATAAVLAYKRPLHGAVAKLGWDECLPRWSPSARRSADTSASLRAATRESGRPTGIYASVQGWAGGLRCAILPVDPLDGTAGEIGTHGFTEGSEKASLTEAREKLEAFELVLDRTFHLGEAQLDPSGVQRVVELALSKMIRELRSLGYRVELLSPSASNPA